MLIGGHPIPPPLFSLLTTDDYEKIGKYSATGLVESPRIRVLEERYGDKILYDPFESLHSVIGKAMHALLFSHADAEKHFAEERIQATVDGVVISGQPDCYDRATKTLFDYKVVATWVATKGGPKPEWIKQINIYRWFMASVGLEVDSAYVCAIYRDWSAMKASFSADYPMRGFQMFPIPLWPLDKTEKYIRHRIRLHEKAETLADDQLPPCTDTERWKAPPKFAVMREGSTRAVKVCGTEEEATEFATLRGERHSVARRDGEPMRCAYFCPVSEFCSQYAAEQKKDEI